jgi:hypothetical protein
VSTKVRLFAEIDFAIQTWTDARRRSKYDDLSDLKDGTLEQVVTTLSSTIERLAPPGSPFRSRCSEILSTWAPQAYHMTHTALVGVLKSLRQAYEHGYLETVEELVHADLFADFLGMAEYLLDGGYKDPAAVLIGGVLEEHLRNLCIKHTISVTIADGSARKASQLNDDLAKVAYDKLVQKGVTYWLDVRNKAAHGKYSEYDENVVRQMLLGVRDFAAKFRA